MKCPVLPTSLFELEQTVDVLEEASNAAGDALADAAGALVDETAPQRERAQAALEAAARQLYTAATLAGQLAAAGRPHPHAAVLGTLRETAERVRLEVGSAPVRDLRQVIGASLKLLNGVLAPAPETLAAEARAFIDRVVENRLPDAANDNRAPAAPAKPGRR